MILLFFRGITIDYEYCKLHEVIKVPQELAMKPNAQEQQQNNFTHIVEAVLRVREETYRHEDMIPRKLDDVWNPSIIIFAPPF